MNRNNQQEEIRELLEKYRQGTCSSEEAARVQHWYDQLALGETGFLEAHPTFEATAAARLRASLPGLQEAPARKTILRNMVYRWTAAAVLTGLLLFTAFYLWPGRSVQQTLTSIDTPGNQVKSITLPDGSKVWLNRFSHLEWKGNLDDSIRLVTLLGEARFDIAADATRPFLVQAGNTVTRVLGTVFNIEAYPGEQEIKMSLRSGSVQFQATANGQPPAILLPGTMARYRTASHELSIAPVENETDAWINGAMAFNEVPLKDAITRIARIQQWQLNWKARDEKNSTVSAVFNRETPQQMLEAIAFTHQLHFRIDQNILTIY
jgi:ferric-dicitrate binding protein FerR (iron transport regulator)